MNSKSLLLAGGIAFILSSSFALAADHPGSDSACADCHSVESSADAPKVIPAKPGILDKLFGDKATPKWHEKIGCTGSASADGKITGCHRPEDKKKSYLVVDLSGKPSDFLCAKCHAPQMDPGLHHPSYKVDKDGNGVPEHFVTVIETKDAVTKLSPSVLSQPLKNYPDAVSFSTGADGQRKLDAAIPLGKFVEVEKNEKKTYERVVTCSSCHNPHFGFQAETGKEENFEKTARKTGDALLRLRDQNNTLCLVCHG
jgi:hypothetical protein